MMGESNYWRWAGRISRRRLLRAGAGAVGVVAWTACAGNTTPPAPAAVTTAPAATAASGSGATAAPAAPTAAAAPKRGGTLRVSSGSQTYPHLDPHLTANSSIFGFQIGLNWSRLLKFKLQGVQLPAFLPTGDVAESFEQPDDLTYVFKLRQNVKWQNIPPVNGRPFTADDVIFSYNRQRTNDPAFVNSSLLRAITKIEAPDKFTVKITVGSPAADFILNIAAPQSVMVARELVEQKGDLKEGPLIGTGAFIVDKLDKLGTTVARRNPDYFLPGQPRIDTYSIQTFADPQTSSQLIVAAFRAGQLDIIPHASVTVKEAEDIKKAVPGAYTLNVKGLGSGTSLGFKMDRKPFDDVRVRQALYKAIDARQVIDTVYGSGWISVGLPLPGIEWSLPEAEINALYKRDVEGAKKLLADAGYANGLDFTWSVGNNNAFFPVAAELIQQQWREINVRATIKQMDGSTFDETVRGRGDFDAYWGSVSQGASADAVLFAGYHSTGPINITRIKDPQLDQMIEKQTSLVRDPEARKKLLLDIQRYILQQGYAHYIHTFEQPAVLQSYVRDFYPGFGALNLEGDHWSLVWLDR